MIYYDRIQTKPTTRQFERRHGRRFVSQVVEIHGYDPDRDEYNYSFIFDSYKEPL